MCCYKTSRATGLHVRGEDAHLRAYCARRRYVNRDYEIPPRAIQFTCAKYVGNDGGMLHTRDDERN